VSDVLLLHAGIADRRMWEPQIEALETAGHRPIASDLPGFGNAPLEPGTIDYIDHARQLGGNAVLGVRFDSSDLGNGLAAIVAYGTAATVRPA